MPEQKRTRLPEPLRRTIAIDPRSVKDKAAAYGLTTQMVSSCMASYPNGERVSRRKFTKPEAREIHRTLTIAQWIEERRR